MNHESDNNLIQPPDNAEAADSLGDALSETDGGFVVEQKQPVSRGTLALFGVIIAAMAGLYLMHVRSGPGSAAAASAETQAANDTISQFLASGDQSIAKMKLLIRDTEKIVAQFLQYPSMKQVPLSDLKTNPFRHQSGSGADDENKSVSEAEANRKREAERVAILKAVQGLSLQSIMHSDASRACMISNTLYQEGQQIDVFVIEKINSHSVIVRSGAYRFELKMQR